MEYRINNICSVRFIALKNIIRYEDNHDGTATIESSQTDTIPIRSGTATMTISGQRTNGYEVFTAQLSARLGTVIQTRCVGILLVEICDDATYIIGTDDLPVTLEATYSLTLKSLQVSHQNAHFPLKTAI